MLARHPEFISGSYEKLKQVERSSRFKKNERIIKQVN